MTLRHEKAVRPGVAVIGCGYRGQTLVRKFHELGALHAIFDSIPAIAFDTARRYRTRVLNFRNILAEPDIQGLVIATPPATHAKLALSAIRAGKHVFVETPLALQISDALAVHEAARSSGCVVLVGHLLRYHPVFERLQQLVKAGDLGRLQYIYAHRLSPGPSKDQEDVLWSLTPDDISMILGLAGEMPVSVESALHTCHRKSIADGATIQLRFPDGMNAHVFASWLNPHKEQKLVVIGSQGMAVFDNRQPWSRKLMLCREPVQWRDGIPVPGEGEANAIFVEQADPLRLECEHFLSCMAEKQRPRIDTQEATNVVDVLDAAARSIVSGEQSLLHRSEINGSSETADSASAVPIFFVHESAYIDDGCEIGAGTKIWYFSHICKGSRIGRNCIVGQNVMVGPDVTVGDHCKLQNNVSLYPGVVLEDGVFCGPSCVFTNVINPRAEIERKNEFRPTIVGRGTTIGANATIVCGHRLGPYCFIGAGAVVIRDVPAHALMAGVPARQIGWMSHAGYRLGPDLTCPVSGQRYNLEPDGGLVRRDDAKEFAE